MTSTVSRDKTDLPRISWSIKDTSCNHHLAYIYVVIHFTNGSYYRGSKKYAYSTCGAGYRAGATYWHGSKRIKYLDVVVGDGIHSDSGRVYV